MFKTFILFFLSFFFLFVNLIFSLIWETERDQWTDKCPICSFTHSLNFCTSRQLGKKQDLRIQFRSPILMTANGIISWVITSFLHGSDLAESWSQQVEVDTEYRCSHVEIGCVNILASRPNDNAPLLEFLWKTHVSYLWERTDAVGFKAA